ncbi:unnamed protein product, partial [Rangifer tarandus platyrhynchus]
MVVLPTCDAIHGDLTNSRNCPGASWMLGCSPRGRPVPQRILQQPPTTTYEHKEAMPMRRALEMLGFASLTVPNSGSDSLGSLGRGWEDLLAVVGGDLGSRTPHVPSTELISPKSRCGLNNPHLPAACKVAGHVTQPGPTPLTPDLDGVCRTGSAGDRAAGAPQEATGAPTAPATIDSRDRRSALTLHVDGSLLSGPKASPHLRSEADQIHTFKITASVGMQVPDLQSSLLSSSPDDSKRGFSSRYQHGEECQELKCE